MNDWTLVTADDEELNEILSGRGSRQGYPWPRRTNRRINLDREVGVLIQESTRPGGERPVALVVSDEASRRLFGRYAQLRSDLSPLSAWTHILDPGQFDHLQNDFSSADHPPQCLPTLSGFEAAWVGLSVAEALMLSDRPLSQLKLVACLATPSFALARAHALWPNETIESVLRRYDHCQRLIRANEGPPNRLREPLMDVWRALIAVSSPLTKDPAPELREIVRALSQLQSARAAGIDAAEAVSAALDLPQTNFLLRLEDMPPEMRVREFDRLVEAIDASGSRRERSGLLFAAGYLVTVVAGGSPSLGLAEKLFTRWPQITAWAYVLGSVGEAITWTSSFDGLGRLVARELLRPFRLDEAPTSDFALMEAAMLVDRGLSDPLVHLRVKQSRVLSVALLAGVNIAVPITEPFVAETRHAPQRSDAVTRPNARMDLEPMALLAEALAPHLLERFKELLGPEATAESPRRSSRSRGVKREAQLPLGVDRYRDR